jgi:hypothetical protein
VQAISISLQPFISLQFFEACFVNSDSVRSTDVFTAAIRLASVLVQESTLPISLLSSCTLAVFLFVSRTHSCQFLD